MHCYCLSELAADPLAFPDIRFDDGEAYCNEWFTSYTLANSYVFIVAGGIAMINVVMKAILRQISAFEG